MANANVFRARQRRKAERQPAFKKMLAGLKAARESMVERILKSDAPVMTASCGTKYKGLNVAYRDMAGVGEPPRFMKVQAGIPFIRNH